MLRKIILAGVLICLMLTSVMGVCATDAAASEPVLLLDFTDEIDIMNYMGSTNALDYDFDEGYLHIISKNGPPAGVGDVFVMFNKGFYFQAEDYPWMKIRLRNHSDVTKFQLHFAATGGMTGATNTLFDISAGDTEFKEYIINIPEANEETFPISSAYSNIGDPEESLWKGTVTAIRLDLMFVDFPGGMVPDDSEMDIEYAAFFDTREAAEAFTLGGSSSTTTPPAETSADPSAEASEAPEVTPTPVPTEEATPTAAATSAAATTASTATDAPSVDNGDSNNGLIIGIVVAAVAVAVIVIVVMVVRKKK